jgi:hypothetical protein
MRIGTNIELQDIQHLLIPKAWYFYIQNIKPCVTFKNLVNQLFGMSIQ